MKNTTDSNSTRRAIKPAKINALFNLLEDKDPSVFMPTMSEIVQLSGSNIHQALAEHQESDSTRIRTRVHQIESIFCTQLRTDKLVKTILKNECDAWKGVLFIESLFNTQFRPQELLRKITELCEQIIKPKLTTMDLAEALHKLNFTTPSEDLLNPDAFSLNNAVHFRCAHPIILALFARQFARQFGLELHIILHKGHHSLIDNEQNLIEPQKLWAVNTLKEDEKVYPCSEKELMMTFCNTLYLSFLAEGQLRPIHKMSHIVSALAGSSPQELPFPLGSKK